MWFWLLDLPDGRLVTRVSGAPGQVTLTSSDVPGWVVARGSSYDNI